MEQEIVSREEWLVARKELLAAEKEFTKERDALSAKRRTLPLVKVESDYAFVGEEGEVKLSELFEGKSQLIVYHFMFGPDWEKGCKSCAFWADNFEGTLSHLAAQDISFKVISNAPLSKLQESKKLNGWHFDWLSAEGTSFGSDYGVSFNGTNEAGYNYSDMMPDGELPGISVFVKLEDGTVCHSYSTYARGLDMLNGAYNYIDLTPKGRVEKSPMDWLKRPYEY